MSWDIYGNPLARGHCEVHPHVHEEYPCSVCMAEKRQREQASQQSEAEYYMQMEIDNLKAERDELAKQLEQHQWISVKDKLPEDNSGLFLCSGHEKTLFVCYRRHHEWFRSPQLQRVVGISHWMQIKQSEAE